MTISVRRAEIADREFVGQDGYLADGVLRRKIAAGEVFLAERDGTPVGYLRLEYLWSDIPYIALISVVERHRQQGVGRGTIGPYRTVAVQRRPHRTL